MSKKASEFIIIRKNYRFIGDPYSKSEAFLHLIINIEEISYCEQTAIVRININKLSEKWHWPEEAVRDFIHSLRDKKLIKLYGLNDITSIEIIDPYFYIPRPLLAGELLANDTEKALF